MLNEDLSPEKEIEKQEHLLMALLKISMQKIHKMTDAKEMWDAIKSSICGNDESQERCKIYLAQQFEGFSVSNIRRAYKDSRISRIIKRKKRGMSETKMGTDWTDRRILKALGRQLMEKVWIGQLIQKMERLCFDGFNSSDSDTESLNKNRPSLMNFKTLIGVPLLLLEKYKGISLNIDKKEQGLYTRL
ncbi:hypothetical protein Tco_0669602 [Tanacetum coccineum]